ncbi:Arylsulfatase B [Orchesella cincta]|uniref:Arylsulfatase B n=1 Tax=Orchesella cincta TaxID=48709 RepID=A0A1D2M2C2_ORCCI|nr:Arylsulfatase B [Orchesella cincta]
MYSNKRCNCDWKASHSFGFAALCDNGSLIGWLTLKERLLPQYLKDRGFHTTLWENGIWDIRLKNSLQRTEDLTHILDTGLGNKITTVIFPLMEKIQMVMDAGDMISEIILKFIVMSLVSMNEAIRLIYNQPTDKPMFLMINHIAPHSANSYDPLQAPRENVNKFRSTIKDENRRKYAGMVDKLDESVGLIIEALSRKKLLSNSIIVFASDNGGAPEGFDLNYSSNWPLRGVKNTLWEGGTRVAAAVWSPFIKSRVSRDIMHAQDWVPTLYEASGGDTRDLKGIDGVSLWKTFTEGHPSPRTSFLYNIDDIYNNSAVREGPWKLIQGNTSSVDLGGGVWDFWYGPSGRSDGLPLVNALVPKIASSTAAKAMVYSGLRLNLTRMGEMQSAAEFLCDQKTTKQVPCNAYQTPCLFNVEEDPCELVQLADRYQPLFSVVSY